MQTYTGQCHCGANGFSVSAEINDVLECNCSIWKATGWQLTFVAAEQVELTSSDDALTDYVFANEHLHHPFCNKCGVHAFSWGNSDDGAKMYSVNTRCLNKFDISTVDINQYDGASL